MLPRVGPGSKIIYIDVLYIAFVGLQENDHTQCMSVHLLDAWVQPFVPTCTQVSEKRDITTCIDLLPSPHTTPYLLCPHTTPSLLCHHTIPSLTPHYSLPHPTLLPLFSVPTLFPTLLPPSPHTIHTTPSHTPHYSLSHSTLLPLFSATTWSRLTILPCTVWSSSCAEERRFVPTGSCHTSSPQPSESHPELRVCEDTDVK